MMLLITYTLFRRRYISLSLTKHMRRFNGKSLWGNIFGGDSGSIPDLRVCLYQISADGKYFFIT